MENGYIDAAFEPEKIELTRAEIRALNKHCEKVRKQIVRDVISAVEDLLEMNKRLEQKRTKMSRGYTEEQKHKYAECLCATLLIDLQVIEDKFMEGEE